MYRFFLEEKQENTFVFHGEDYRHFISSLRHQEGDMVEVIYGNTLYTCSVTKIEKKEALLSILEEKPLEAVKPKVYLVQGLCKGSKMEWIVQKCVELGVHEIIPVFTSRSVVRPTNKDEKKAERLQEIAKAAAKQSKGTYIPKVHDFLELKDVLESMQGQILLAYENEKKHTLKERLQSLNQEEEIYIVIGPEGGLSEEEVEWFQEKDAKIISLGERILRAETAGMILLSLIQYEAGRIG